MNLVLRRSSATAAAVALTLTVWAVPAAAHVTVDPGEAAQGGYAKLTFRVPNEKDTASTTKLEVALPADAPLASVSVKPVTGWKVEVVKAKLATPIKAHDLEITEAVSRIVWTADGPATAVKPGQFAEFDISAGPLPEKDTMVLKALQTYSDGEIVRWIEEPTGGTEPEYPALVLKLTTSAQATPSAGAVVTAQADAGKQSGGRWGIGLGLAGLLVGLAGLILGGLAFARSRRTTTPTTPTTTT